MNARLTTAILGGVLGLAALATTSPALAGEWNEAVSARASLLNDPQAPAGSVMASIWSTPVSGKTSVSGAPQIADRAADWTKAVSAKAELRGTAQASGHGPYGFLAEAMQKGGGAASEELAAW